MTRIVQLVVLAVLLLVLAISLGCPKKNQEPVTAAGGPVAGTAGGPAAPGAAPVAPAGKEAGPAQALAQKQASLKSYVMTMTIDGKPMGKHYMKMENGKPVRMRVDMPGGKGYMLMLIDKNLMYMVDPQAKTAMKMESPKQGEAGSASEMPGMPGASGMPKMPELKDLQGPTWQTDTIDGVACWKVEVPGGGTTWIDKEYGLPRQMQTGKQTIKNAYDKINAVPDSEFELPKGIKETSMPGMPNMPGMPKMPGG